MKLNAAQIAALASGASAEAVASLATVDPAVVEPTAEQVAAAAAAAAPAPVVAVPVPAPVAAIVPAPEAPNPLIAHLTTQLAEANTSLIAAKVEAGAFKAAADAQEGLMAIARSSLGKMNVALGGSAEAAQTFSATTIVAEHARVTDVFQAKFKVGGAAAVASPAEPKAALDPVLEAYFANSVPQ